MKLTHKTLPGLIFLLSLFILSQSCKKQRGSIDLELQHPTPAPPLVNPPVDTTITNELPKADTDTITSVGPSTVTCFGNVVSEGTSAVSARGFCWNTQPNPTTADNKILLGTGPGGIGATIKGLKPGATYFIRAFATNAKGTAYGKAKTVTTLQNAPGTVTDADGNVYQTIKIGNQEWLVQNLRTTSYQNGDPIPFNDHDATWQNASTGLYCFINYDVNTVANFGLMYNHFVIEDPRQIAPHGWHVPSLAEWDTLSIFLGGYTVSGGKLKEAGTANWYSPNAGATNESGFTARGGGIRSLTGATFSFKQVGGFWTTVSLPGNLAWYTALGADNTELGNGMIQRNSGLHIRCVKDQ